MTTQLSKPFVDEKYGRAIIFVRYSSSDWSNNRFIWLKMDDEKWKIYDDLNTDEH